MNLLYVNEEARTRNHEVLHLHGLPNRAVLASRCWADPTQNACCEFLLDYEEEEEEEEDPGAKKSKKKKPLRLRWTDEFRDEFLARLLELNEQRHQEELLAGPQSTNHKPVKTASNPKKTSRKPSPKQPELEF